VTAGPPLAGLKVLDLTRLLPGDHATMILADLGADVLKVEEPGRGDYVRGFPPYLPDGEAGAHVAINRGKRSLTLNLRDSRGVEILTRLAAGADVLVESYRPGVMERLGAGYETLRAVNPGLVYVAITGYGQDGPYRDTAGHDIDYLALTGGLSFTGAPGTAWHTDLQVADIGAGGLMAVIAVLAALRARERTGEGQFCDVSMTDGMLSWLAMHIGVYAASGRPPATGTGMLGGGLACYQVYACADGRHVAVGALEERFFAALLDVLGLPADLAGRQYDPAAQADLRERLADRFAARSRDEWVVAFAGVDACVAPVLDLPAALAHPHHRARGMVEDVKRPDGTVIPQVGVVPRFSATPGRPGGTPSPLGADTAAVLAELGYDEAAVAALRADGVL
jgi:crotonobetainyl-CoA:carnitine CoA-transferase CaiB-like acyl-CoA transferase